MAGEYHAELKSLHFVCNIYGNSKRRLKHTSSLLRKSNFKMNLICDFLIARAQPNNLCWMFSSNCTRSCGFRNSGIALFAISMLLGLEVLGACNWLSACRKICIVSSANKPNNEIKTSSIFFPLWLVLKDKAHKLQVRHRLLYPRRLSWKNYCLFRSDVSCAHFLARTYVRQDKTSQLMVFFFKVRCITRAISVYSLWKLSRSAGESDPPRSAWS